MSDTPLIAAVRLRRVADVAALLAIGVDANEPMTDGSGRTALHLACALQHTEIASKLLAAKANVDQANSDGVTPMFIAIIKGHLGIVQLLSSYGARRTFPLNPPGTAEEVAAHCGHHDVAAWLVTSRFWTPLHHLEVLTPERALAEGGRRRHSRRPHARAAARRRRRRRRRCARGDFLLARAGTRPRDGGGGSGEPREAAPADADAADGEAPEEVSAQEDQDGDVGRGPDPLPRHPPRRRAHARRHLARALARPGRRSRARFPPAAARGII